MNRETSEKDSNRESLGDFLKKKRIAEGKTLEAVAREELFRIDHLKAIEAGLWNELPGEAYARAYLISLSKRYKLDREELLNWYASETGQKRDSGTSTLLLDDESSHPIHYSRSSLLIVLALVAFALVIYNSLRSDDAPSPAHQPPPQQPEEPIAAQIDSSDDGALLEVNEHDTQLSSEDLSSLITPSSPEKKSSIEAPHASSSSTKPLSSAALSSAHSSIALSSLQKSSSTIKLSSQLSSQSKPATVPSHLVISCEKDSAWIEILTASDPAWAVWVREKGAIYSRSSTDTMHIRTGNGELLRYQLNGKPIETPKAANFSIFNGQRVR